MMIFLVALSASIFTFFLILLLITYVKRARGLDIFHRLRRHYLADDINNMPDNGILSKLYPLIQKIAKPFSNWNLMQLPEKKLRQAGIPILGAESIIIALISAGIAFLIAYMITLDLRIAIIAAVIVPAILWMSVLVKIQNRRNAFTEQLCDCLTTVSNALRAGYSFQQSMDVISKEMEPPISEEFAHVTNDVSMGITLEDALDQMAKRVDSSDFDLVVTAVLIQREVGGNLAQVLDSISDTIAERIRMKREIKALTAQGRMSAAVLLILPFAVGAFMYFFNHDQFIVLFEEEFGRIAIAVAIVMEIIGIFVIRRIVDIEV